MKIKLRVITISVFFLTVFMVNQSYSQLADSPWPMFMHDARHTGRSQYIGPSQPNLAWERRVSDNKPIIGKNGIIYTYYYEDGILALRLDGTVADTGDVARLQVVTKDNAIYFKRDSSLYALNPNGSLKWKCWVGSGWGSNIVLDAQGDIFLANTDYLSSIDPGGILFWQVPLKPVSDRSWILCDPAIAEDGTVYVVDGDGLKAIRQDGTLKWTYRIWFSDEVRNSISIGNDGTIYLGQRPTFSSDPLLCALNPDGTKKWEVKKISDPDISYSQERGVRSPSAIGLDGTIYFGEKVWFPDHGFLYAVNPDGSIRWTYKAKKGFPGSPIVDAEGKVYAVSGVGDLYCFDSNGTILWQYNIYTPYGALINYSYPAIDSLGTLYVAAGDQYGVKLCVFFNINPAHTPDLSVIADSITFEPSSGAAVAGTEVKIRVPIKEIGGFQSAAFDVIFYADDFSHQIDSLRAYAPANFTTHIEGAWDTEDFTAKTYQIIIVVKNANPAESNISNNQAQTTYQLLPSIQERIDLAQAGDTVWVAPGTYYENLTLKKGVVVKSTHGPEQTIIDGRNKDSVIKAPHLDPTAVLDGFTITNGKAQTFGGGGVFIDRGGVTIQNNIIRGNDATEGGAIWMIGSFVESDPVIENNLIIDNHASFDGGAVYANNSWALFRNNTVVNNSSSFSDRAGGIHTVGYFSPTAGIVNCIIWGNGINLGGTAAGTYSCIQSSSSGTGNISTDPKFVDPANGDYRLQEGSPCIDTGDPASLRDPDGTRADMGWKYYDQSATIAQIKGRLTDATTGAPVSMAKIYLSGPRDDLVPPDVNGNYVFAVPADTGYSVSVYAPNHASAKQENVSGRIGEATEINFSLVPYPTEITLFPPTDFQCLYSNGKVHLNWQRPKEEHAFDDGFYEEAVGFLNQQGILAAGPFVPNVYPAKIEIIKVAFDGESAGDNIDLMVYLDPTGTAQEPSSSQLVYSRTNLTIEIGGGFQEINVKSEGITLNEGVFFIGIKQNNTRPMYLLLDHTAPDGNSFCDDDIDGTFDKLSSQDIHGALAIRAIVSIPTSGSQMSKLKISQNLLPNNEINQQIGIKMFGNENKNPGGLITKPIKNCENDLAFLKTRLESNVIINKPQTIYIYRSETTPLQITTVNKIATLSGSATSYDDMNLGNIQKYYYVVVAKYASGENLSSTEVSVDITTALDDHISQNIPKKYGLFQNIPNPFNPETIIQYQLPKKSKVRLEVYNIVGKLIKTLINKSQTAGYYTIRWNGNDKYGHPVASGVYLYKIMTEEFVQVRKMLLIR